MDIARRGIFNKKESHLLVLRIFTSLQPLISNTQKKKFGLKHNKFSRVLIGPVRFDLEIPFFFFLLPSTMNPNKQSRHFLE